MSLSLKDIQPTELAGYLKSKKSTPFFEAVLAAGELGDGLRWQIDVKQTTSKMLIFHSTRWLSAKGADPTNEKWIGSPVILSIDYTHGSAMLDCFEEGYVSLAYGQAVAMAGYQCKSYWGATKTVNSAYESLSAYLEAANIICKPFCLERRDVLAPTPPAS